MRGQAFVSFASSEIAAKAMREVRGFPLYSKPMVGRFSFTIGPIVILTLHHSKYRLLDRDQTRS